MMKAAFLTRQGFEFREQDIPSCGPDEVLVKTLVCGVCEGEVQHYRIRANMNPPEYLLGHEGSGIVEKVGANVTGLKAGDAVTALGGKFTEYFVVPAERLVKLPSGVDPRWALGEPVACVIHAGNRFGTRVGDRVAVVGCGFMGLVALAVARLQGAAFICAFDPIPSRLKMAEQMGADVRINPQGRTPADVLKEVGGEFDVVIEAAGVQSAIDWCGELVRQHGRIVLIGYHMSDGGKRTINMQLWNYKAIDVVNGHCRRRAEKMAAMEAGVRLMAAGRLNLAPLVTYYDLSAVAEAFHDLDTRKEGLFKAALVMGAV
ncbi:MAG: zinc-binding dehydrogenase [Lentisphaerae bacterium]|nr:zinc-binding dehydrogenase [Lentisphaerota bacterium]